MKTLILSQKSKSINFFTILFFFLISNSLLSQNNTKFRGIVVDSETKDKLQFVDVIVEEANISTVTNSEGEFLIKIPNNRLNETIIFSHLGYKKQMLLISKLSSGNNIIKLDEAATILAQVDLNFPKNAENLVRKALKKKGQNYNTNPSTLTAFYRETIKKRNKNASLSEAIVEIDKAAYNSSKKDGIKLIKARKNTNYSRLDTLALKLQGGPFSTLYTDLMKYPEFIFNENNLSRYIFKFEKSTQINNKLIYVVHFEQKRKEANPLYYGKLYIDAGSYALTSAVYNLNVSNKKLASAYFVRKKPKKVTVYPTEAAYRVNYRTLNGKWYYTYGNIQLAFKVDWKNKLFNSRYTLQSEMAITDWQQGAIDKLSQTKRKLKPSTILANEASGFSDPKFWGEYNIIEPEKSIESAIKKISKQLKKTS